MEDDTTVVVQDNKFVPEPVPDNIADTEINGLEQAQTDEDVPTETVDDETSDTEAEDTTEAEESETPVEEAKPTEEPVAPTTKPTATEELTGAERRLAEKAQRDYVAEERQKIREYEQTADTSDLEERLKIMEAKDYVNTIERNRQAITQDVAAAQQLPFFSANTEQSKLLFQQSLENFAQAYGVTDPETGEWIGAMDRNGKEVSLLPYLQQQATTYEQAIKDAKDTARAEVQQSEAKMRAKAVNPSNAGKARSSGDDLEDLLDRIGDTPLM